MAESNVFQQLKPYCIRVAQGPTVKNISELKDVLQLMTKDVFKEEGMVQYVFFPLKLAVERIKRTDEKLLLKTLDCIYLILPHHNLTSQQLFLEIFDMCCVLLSSKRHAVGREMLAEISEELKMKIISVMKILLISSNKSVLLFLCSQANLPRLGHAISLVLALSEFEKDRELRLESSRCLHYLALEHVATSDDELQLVSDVYCSFIPGITITFSRILLDTSNIGQNVLVSIIERMKDFILLVMADSRFDFLKEGSSLEEIAVKLEALSNLGQRTKPANSGLCNERSICINRDKAWMEKTASNISILIGRFAPRAAYHSSPKVRSAVISFAESLLKECAISLSPSVPILIEVLAGMQQDDYDAISDEARRAIACCKIALHKGGKSLYTIMEEKLYDKLLSLPRIMRSANDDKKIVALCVLLGYFNLLGDRLADVLNSMSVLEKLLKSFIQVLELDVHDVKIVEEKNPVPSEEMIDQSSFVSHDNNMISHRFKNFKDMRIFHTIEKICFSIGEFAEFKVVVDYLLEQLLSSSIHRKETVLFLNEMLRCRIKIEDNLVYTSEKDPPITPVIDQIITTYLRDDFWFLPTSNINDVSGAAKNFLGDQLTLLRAEARVNQLSYWEKGIPIEQINSNIQLICLMIDGIAISSSIRNFSVFLIKVIYPLLEKLGNENAQIANTALNALSAISKNCKRGSKQHNLERTMHRAHRGSIAELISNNADYLINSISMSFRHLTLLSSAPCVLSVMLTYSNREILPLVADVIQDVFHYLDLYQEEVAFSLMKVLKSLALAVHKWFGQEPNDDTLGDNILKQSWNKVITPKELGSFVTNYCQQKIESLGGVESDDELAENTDECKEFPSVEPTEEDVYKDEKTKLPVHFEVTLTALEKCKHFLPSDDIALQQLTLDVIQSCIQALHQHQNDLLPVVHRIWPSLVGRIKHSQHIIVSTTVDVLNTMVDCTGDFLRQRIRTDVYPFLIEYLTTNQHASQKGGPMYRFSPTCKTQTKLLHLIDTMIQRLGLNNEDLWRIAIACSGYLDCRQPLQVQNEAINVFNSLKVVDWSTTWLILSSLYSSQELIAPNSCFKDASLISDCFSRNVFTDNVTKVLYHENLCA